MKKLLSLLAILSIVLSVTFLFSCEDGSYCCQDQHSSANQCSTCSNHLETSYSNTTIFTQLVFSPKIVGHIFFTLIHIDLNHVVFSPDRPPAFFS